MYQLHVIAGEAHYIRLTETQPRERQVKKYTGLGAEVWVEEVLPNEVHPLAELRKLVRIDTGGEDSGD